MVRKNVCRGYALRIVIGITLLVLLFTDIAGAATITIPTDYAKIQWAIDNATVGDTIEVHSGVYYENVNVSKRLILLGVDTGGNKPIINASGNGSPITLSADGIVLEGFIAVNSGRNADFLYDIDSGIKVTSNNNSLIGNNILNNLYGIYLQSNTNNNIITGNNISENDQGIFINNYIPAGSGINNTLIGNNISNNSQGIFLAWSSRNILSSNIITFNGKGIILDGSSSNNILRDNVVDLNGYSGITLIYDEMVMAPMNNQIINNTINFNGHVGIYYISSLNNISNNTISSNGDYGILMNGKFGGGVINGNNLSNNSIGISISPGEYSGDILVYNNYFNNTINAYGEEPYIFVYKFISWNVSKTTGTNIIGGSYLGGNFWANPSGTGFSQTCTDVDKDGICDSQYVLDANNTDYLPLSMNFKTRYTYGGILQPINADGTSVFKLGSIIPVKFQLLDTNGSFVTNAVAKIYVAKISDGIVGTDVEANSTSNATTGNLFRYDSTNNQYIFNLATKTLSTGTWQIRIELDDGISKYVTISLR